MVLVTRTVAGAQAQRMDSKDAAMLLGKAADKAEFTGRLENSGHDTAMSEKHDGAVIKLDNDGQLGDAFQARATHALSTGDKRKA